MNGLENLAKIIIVLGVIILVIGVILLFSAIAGFSFFKLPGDIVIRRGNFTLYFPWVSMILLSIVISIILNQLYRK